MENKFTAVVLAGGQSSRMKKNKALCQLGNKMLIEYSLDLFKKRNYEIIISGKKSEYSFLNFPVIEDNFENIGPIAGIEACMSSSKYQKIIFTSCDTPFLTEFVLLEFEKYASEFEIVVPVVKGYLQPMTALYSKNLHQKINSLIKQGLPYPKDIIAQSNTKKITINNSLHFFNINSQPELKEAENILRKQF